MSDVRRVLVTGSSGQLGTVIVDAFSGYQIAAHTHASLDITNIEAVKRAVAEARPDVIVNCAAFNLVDEAENRPLDAFAVNAFAVRTLARAAEERGATLVHYGSDFVFSGIGGPDSLPYDEPAPWYEPVRLRLGAVLLAAGRAPEAEKVYRDDLTRNLNNGWSLYGLKESLTAQKNTKQANEAEKKFKKAWARADVELNSTRF